MTCKKCGKDFNPHDNATIGHHDSDAVEVRTRCAHGCGAEYYTYTAPYFVAQEDYQSLVASEQAAGRLARPKKIKSRIAVRPRS